MGESLRDKKIGDDEAIMPFISSANIACGFHGGDPVVMNETIRHAAAKGVAIGAHPSFPDLENFGRKEWQMDPQEVHDIVVYQVSAMIGMAKVMGARVHHVKPHGALYNMAARIPSYAEAIASAVAQLDKRLILYGLSGSCLVQEARKAGLKPASEVFADRTYQQDGSLTPRSMPNAVITEADLAVQQVLMMLRDGKVKTIQGGYVNIEADTICIHGDHEGSSQFARLLNTRLTEEGFSIKAIQADD
jgi:UPF0271 protein